MADARLAALGMALLLGATPVAADPLTDLVLAPESLRDCTVCHGVELNGNRSVDAPKLAGLPAWYLDRQMLAFRNGWRGVHELDVTGMEMRPQAQVLSAEETARAVTYAASVPAHDPAPTVHGDAARGAELYRSCAACHGERGRGNEALWSPPLAGQSDWYLLTQMKNFRAGARGSAPDDTQGAVMRAAALALPDDDAAADVVAYIATFETPERGDSP